MAKGFTLSFNISNTNKFSNRIAFFQTLEDKRSYISAERCRCKYSFNNLHQSVSNKTRKNAKKALDEARWNFFLSWTKLTQLEKVMA